MRLGQTARAGQILDKLAGQVRCQPEIRIAAAALRIAQDDPSTALAELAQVLDNPVPDILGPWIITAHALEAVARDVLGDRGAAERALERALDLAEPDEVLVPFLLSSVQALLERHPPHRTRLSHRRDPQPVRVCQARAATSLARAADRAAQWQRDPRAALPAH